MSTEATVAGRQITEYEKQLLRHLVGEQVEGLMWGAAISVAVEHLHGAGLVERRLRDGVIAYEITEAGRKVVAGC